MDENEPFNANLKLAPAPTSGVRIAPERPYRIEHPTLPGVWVETRPVNELEYTDASWEAVDAWIAYWRAFGKTKAPIAESKKALHLLATNFGGIMDAGGNPIPFEKDADGYPTDATVEILMMPVFSYKEKIEWENPEKPGEKSSAEVKRMFVHAILGGIRKIIEDPDTGKA